GEVREHAQLDLRVVRADEHATSWRPEGAPYLTAGLRAHGDVLDVRLARRQPAGSRARLVERGVEPAGRGRQVAGERLNVGAQELRQLAVLEQRLRQRVVRLACEAVEDLRVGRASRSRLLDDRQVEAIEEDLAQLL